MSNLESPRARLRRLRHSDFERMRLLEADPGIMRFTPSRTPQTESQTRARLDSQIARQAEFEPFGIWLAEEKLTGAFLGWFMLIPVEEKFLELGFMLVRDKWGKGFATEIGGALIEFARERGIDGLKAKTNTDNFASMRVLEKLGFLHEGHSMPSEKTGGVEVELKVFHLKFR